MHIKLIRGHGIYISELLALDKLCVAGRPTFLFVLAPLPLVGAVGSPVAPVAVLLSRPQSHAQPGELFRPLARSPELHKRFRRARQPESCYQHSC
jgi:hypothetical protein